MSAWKQEERNTATETEKLIYYDGFVTVCMHQICQATLGVSLPRDGGRVRGGGRGGVRPGPEGEPSR